MCVLRIFVKCICAGRAGLWYDLIGRHAKRGDCAQRAGAAVRRSRSISSRRQAAGVQNLNRAKWANVAKLTTRWGQP
jgi:hypothetical protein